LFGAIKLATQAKNAAGEQLRKFAVPLLRAKLFEVL